MSDSPYEPKGVKSLFGGKTKKGRRPIYVAESYNGLSSHQTSRMNEECREIWRLTYSNAVIAGTAWQATRHQYIQVADGAVEDYLKRFYPNVWEGLKKDDTQDI